MRAHFMARVALLAALTFFSVHPAAIAQWPDDPSQGWLGVMLGGAGAAPRAEDQEPPPGILISGIIQESPADKAGLRARDRILAVDGTPVSSSRELVSRVKSLPPSSWISLSVERNGEQAQVRLRLGTRPREIGRLQVRRGWVGIEAIDLPPSLRGHFGAPEESGVMISHIEPGSPAEAAGFELGDVVYAVVGEPARSSRELSAMVRRGGVGNTLEFTLAREGVEIVLESLVQQAPQDAERD